MEYSCTNRASVTYAFLPRLRDNFGGGHGKSIRAKDGKNVDEYKKTVSPNVIGQLHIYTHRVVKPLIRPTQAKVRPNSIINMGIRHEAPLLA